jgi:outer membrane protein, heavy metal efflux system
MMRAALLLLVAAAPAAAQTAPAATPIALAEVERLALQNNPTVRAAAAAVDAERGRIRQAGAWPNPVIGYAGDEIPVGEQLAPRGGHGVFLEQTIPLGGRLRLSRAVVERAVQQAEALQDLQRLRILTSVRDAFYQVLLQERRVEVQERLAALASEAVGVTAQLFNVGAADRPDFLESEIESRRVQLELNEARNIVLAARQRLAAIAGAPGIAARPLAGRVDEAVPDLQREQVVRDLLAQSPALRAARAALDRARAATARARRETAPDLFLRGGADYNREHDAGSLEPIGWEANVEAGVSIPLFNRNAGGTAAARAEEARAEAEIARLELALQARAAETFAEYLTARHASEAYHAEILPRAEEAYALYLARYKEMAAAYPQVLVAQRTLFEMSAAYLASLERAWRAALQLQGFLPGDALDAPGEGGASQDRAAAPGADSTGKL